MIARFPRSIVVLAFLALLALPAMAQGMTLEQALQKHYAARGGLEKMDAVQSLHMAGKLALPQGMEAPLETWWKAPNLFRVEFSFQGMKAVQVFDGREGWSLMPFMGKTEPEPMPAEQVEKAKAQADWKGILVHADTRGARLEWKGKAEVDGSPAWRIDVVGRDGTRVEVYLDGETFLERREVRHVERGGQTLEVHADYADYREVGGLVFPFTMRTSVAGMPGGQSITIEKVEVDPDLPASLFGKPQPAAKPAAPAPGR